MPELPDGSIELVPDWVCEVLSPTTRRHNALLVSKLEGSHWVDLQRFGDQTAARIAPFEEIEIDVAEWWTLLGPDPA